MEKKKKILRENRSDINKSVTFYHVLIKSQERRQVLTL